ncbi:MAG: hypothetical protein WCA20_06875 [Candidatus Sulfotelmatobacter sp.]
MKLGGVRDDDIASLPIANHQAAFPLGTMKRYQQTGLLRTMPKPVQRLAKTRFMKWITKRVGVTQGSISFSGASLAKLLLIPPTGTRLASIFSRITAHSVIRDLLNFPMTNSGH